MLRLLQRKKRNGKRLPGSYGGRIIVVEGFEQPSKKKAKPEPPKLSEEERYRLLAGEHLLSEEELEQRRRFHEIAGV